jgi:hypothetical protein
VLSARLGAALALLGASALDAFRVAALTIGATVIIVAADAGHLVRRGRPPATRMSSFRVP